MKSMESKFDKKGLKKILDYIHKHHTDYNFSLEGISKFFGMGHSCFSRNFKEKAGVTFRKYLTTLKANVLSKAISEKYDISLRELADIFKTDCESNVSNFFKRTTGMTITEYKRQIIISKKYLLKEEGETYEHIENVGDRG